ncbi:hypothetical protein CDD81_6291 [Ophiocordyceps australis]|uniref:Regulator of chromosome condensation 1/beta-lactamase-inhibitor protein II n=1 Tax=Ophiocordyceps australis TaxID=1399860 RepID=A0A2C5Y6T1_9HYPO|nr:hypothetical protein CDD81_6291 [Ophiocordyceps australis]
MDLIVLQPTGIMMLYAAGFNAWNQLCFDRKHEESEPNDVFAFTKVLEAQHIDPPVSRQSYTLVRHDGCLSMAGFGLQDQEAYQAAYSSAEAENDEILDVVDDAPDISSAANEGVPQHRLVKYASASARAARTADKTWPCKKPVSAVAAFATGFIILHQDGTVDTLGDARYQDCLGRQVDDESPAEDPCLVSDLADLDEPVTHVSAGGYTLAALTRSGALYLWGTCPTNVQAGQNFMPNLNNIPNYVQVDGDEDVRDVALGESHAIVLMMDGALHVIGDNGNGQLGLGDSTVKGCSSWTKVSLNLPQGHQVVAVAAGPRASFILTASKSTLDNHDADICSNP